MNMQGKQSIVGVVILAVLGCAMLCAPPRAASQANTTLNLEQDRPFFFTLDGEWRFHPGDDARYADPGFDDSKWALIRGNRSWDAQGFKGLSGLAWYRTKVRIPAGDRQLAVYVRGIDDSSQIFLDGKPIGSFGEMPPHPRAEYQIRRLYPLLLSPSPQPRIMTLAVRVWHWPHWAAKFEGGMLSPIRIGDAAFLRMLMNLDLHDEAWNAVDDIVLIGLWSLTGIAALALFALRREREYLWFGVYLLLTAALDCFRIYARFHSLGAKDADLIRDFLRCPIQLIEMAFYFYLLRGKRNGLFWTAIVTSALIGPIVHVLVYMEYGNYAAWNMVNIALTLPFRLWILILVFQRTRQGLLDARLLLGPVLIQQLTSIFSTSILVAQYLGWRGRTHWFFAVSEWPFEFSVVDVADMLFLVAMVAIFLYRFYRNSREQEDLKREREAARTVQQILVPEANREVPGFKVHSVYKPASEIGGDFFQILPLAAGGVLIVIGDLSGKGLPAAMTVSLLVGTIRTIAHYTHSPGEILTTMNQRLLGRTNGGFTTCQALRIGPGGILTIANAGHLHPYVDGKELSAENGLPLGIDADATYVETTHLLSPNQQLTVMTDGVVEATSAVGELYGFDRTAILSVEPAEQIARTAQSFGQGDDITVLTVMRLLAA
jgi:hypothetical protein